MLSMVTVHPSGIFVFACLRLYIPCLTMQHEAMTTFLHVHSVCDSSGVVMYCIYTVIRVSWGIGFFCATQVSFYIAYLILFVISIKMLTSKK